MKGANLAMETTEAELHGWNAAPYRTKADVDASYARLIDAALRPEHAEAVRVGIASHNLFHLSWALEVARSRGVEAQVDVEMLEGMANSESLAIARTGQRVLLYAPVTRHDDFASAVAYLVRRLDENTSDENYLKAAFDIGTDVAAIRRAERTIHGVGARTTRHLDHVTSPRASESRRTRRASPTSRTSTRPRRAPSTTSREPSTRFARHRNCTSLSSSAARSSSRTRSRSATIRAPTRDRGIGTASPTIEQVDEAVRCAARAQEHWSDSLDRGPSTDPLRRPRS